MRVRARLPQSLAVVLLVAGVIAGASLANLHLPPGTLPSFSLPFAGNLQPYTGPLDQVEQM